ncbi:DUF4174 domain-containing protein [Winogradskyella flava]|uniref:DUF4174 domain-containing protein n=1 Tax=Winogradskyella flava TaxID=1884876 RepID=UPI002492B237|nr:DUF4174 domain-containing protein [Winogradskyella flava]
MKYLILIAVLSVSAISNSQELEKYKWSNRILLVVSKTETFNKAELQIKNLLLKPKELSERKLLIYRIHPNIYRIENSNDSDWIINSKLYKTYNAKDDEFKIVLIGLDGGIKLSQNDVLSTEALFSKIDSMPMRASELKNKQ